MPPFNSLLNLNHSATILGKRPGSAGGDWTLPLGKICMVGLTGSEAVNPATDGLLFLRRIDLYTLRRMKVK